ncbi:PIN-like domain-containing protein [Kitasatospora sp. NPDC127067]|uniref:PIN-like domain-containing protein n=1 Tax=Kitasatospora sp. NPDC127067 TaxID=3347126 RepID=UPI0036543696
MISAIFTCRGGLAEWGRLVMAGVSHASVGGGYGLFDGFEGYRTPSREDYRRVLSEGIIAFDANVLLNLYRYNEETRDSLLSIMGVLGERFWVPHQALNEFWRNRESTLNTPTDKAKEAVTALEKAGRAAADAISSWVKNVALPEERHAEIADQLAGAFEKVRRVILSQAENDTVPRARDTNQDPLLSRLSSVLAGRVGAPLPPEDHAVALKEAKRRAEAEEPPGYMDYKKTGDLVAGDYLVWEQLLREVERRKCDVLFVTSDVKDDWWRKWRDDLRGPRLELMAELRSRTQQQLFMLQPKELLKHADALQGVQVSPESVEEVARVDRLPDAVSNRSDGTASLAGQLPAEVHELILIEIYRQAHELDWDFLTNSEKAGQYRQWVEDPRVGGVLLSHVPEQSARMWIKDVPMRDYARSQEGVGRYARYAVMRFRGPEEIVHSACGTGWEVVPDSVGEKPMHCYATDGTTTRYVCWGPTQDFKNLVWAALNSVGESRERPAVVITTRDGDTVTATADREEQAQLGERSGVDLSYLHRSMIENPDYVG